MLPLTNFVMRFASSAFRCNLADILWRLKVKLKPNYKAIGEDEEKKLATSNHIEMVHTKEAAAILGVTKKTLRRWEIEGRVLFREPPGRFHRRFIREEIETIAAQRRKLKATRLAKRGSNA
jgi:excisionase family DNA binding protein